MSGIIVDPITGSGARVSTGGLLNVQSESIPTGVYAALNRKLYTLNTGDVTLNNTSESAVLFLKYTGSEKLVIPIAFFTLISTNATGTSAALIYRNPTSISNGTAFNAIPRNFAGSDTLSGTKERVTTSGESFTGGEQFAQFTTSALGLNTFNIDSEPFVLETNNSIGFSIEPGTGNTAGTFRFAFLVYEISLT